MDGFKSTIAIVAWAYVCVSSERRNVCYLERKVAAEQHPERAVREWRRSDRLLQNMQNNDVSVAGAREAESVRVTRAIGSRATLTPTRRKSTTVKAPTEIYLACRPERAREHQHERSARERGPLANRVRDPRNDRRQQHEIVAA